MLIWKNVFLDSNCSLVRDEKEGVVGCGISLLPKKKTRYESYNHFE